MKQKLSLMLLAAVVIAVVAQGIIGQTAPPFHRWAQKPTVTEEQTRAHADFMADRLKRYGWQYVVVDIQWYEPEAKGYDYRKDAKLELDQWGRLWPAVNRFPSAANGIGFKALAESIHRRGLKFGLHLMRGIPRQAVAQNTSGSF